MSLLRNICLLMFFTACLYSSTFISAIYAQEATLSCYVTSASCDPNDIDLLLMSGETNAHADTLPTSGYIYNLCCGIDLLGEELGISNACPSPIYNKALKLSSVSNAHASQVAESPYTVDICISPNDPQIADVYCLPYAQNPACPSDFQCVVSLSSPQNAHLGQCGEYANEICCRVLADTVPPITYLNITSGIWYNGPQSILMTCEDGTNPSVGCNVTQYCNSTAPTCTPDENATIWQDLGKELKSLVYMETTTNMTYRSVDNAWNYETPQTANIKICNMTDLDITINCPGGACAPGDSITFTPTLTDGCPTPSLTGSTTHIQLEAQSTNPECVFGVTIAPIEVECTSLPCTQDWTFPDFSGTVCAGKTIELRDAFVSEKRDGLIPIVTYGRDPTYFDTTGFYAQLSLNLGDKYAIQRKVNATINVTYTGGNIDQCQINWFDGNVSSLCDGDCNNPLEMNETHTYVADGQKMAELNCTAGSETLIITSNVIFIDSYAPTLIPYFVDQLTPNRRPVLHVGLYDNPPSSLFNDTGYCNVSGGESLDVPGTDVTWDCHLDFDGFYKTCTPNGDLADGRHVLLVECNDNAGSFTGRPASQNETWVRIGRSGCNLTLHYNGDFGYHANAPLPITWGAVFEAEKFNLHWNDTDEGDDETTIPSWYEFDTPPGRFTPSYSNPVLPPASTTGFQNYQGFAYFACNVTDNETGTESEYTVRSVFIDNTQPVVGLDEIGAYTGTTIPLSWTVTQMPASGIKKFMVQYNMTSDPESPGTYMLWLDDYFETNATFGNGFPIDVEDNHMYCFQAKAVSRAGVESEWSNTECVISDSRKPELSVRVYNSQGGELDVMGRYFIAGDAEQVDIYSTATDDGSFLVAPHVIDIQIPSEAGSQSCSWGGTLSVQECSMLNLDLEAGRAEFTVKAQDAVGNTAFEKYYVIPNPLANFNVHDLYLVFGETADSSISVRNLYDVVDTVHLTLGDFDMGIVVFLDSGTQELDVQVGSKEQKTVFFKLISTEPPYEALPLSEVTLDAVSTVDPTLRIEDEILNVYVVSPSEFPGLELPAILIMVFISGMIFFKIAKKEQE